MSITKGPCVWSICAIVVTCFVATSLSTPIDNGGDILNTVYLGTVDGKSYFSENTVKNWTAGEVFCAESGMQLATITSEAQATFLDNAHNNVTFTGEYWTDGRDSQTMSQFAWGRTKGEINATLVPLQNTIPLHNCLLYTSTSGKSYYHSHPCVGSTGKSLCEVIHT